MRILAACLVASAVLAGGPAASLARNQEPPFDDPNFVRAPRVLAATPPLVPAAAPPQGGEPARADRGEPLLNGDYYLNYFYNIPRFFTAPARFDATDWMVFGGVAGATALSFALDENLRGWFDDHQGGIADDLATVGYRLGDSKTVFAGSLAAYAAGYALGDARLKETGLLVLQAWGLSQILSESTKRLAGRERPGTTENSLDFHGPGGGGKHRSFVSGHAVNAFAVASVISEQYDAVPWAAPVAYTFAAFVGWSRLQREDHWLSDVVVGAAIGYGMGKIVAHFSPFRDNPDMSVLPLAAPGGGGVQLGFRF